MNKIIALVAVGILVFSAVVIGSMYVSYNNTEVTLRSQAEAQRGKIEATYDQMWKIIQQKAQVTDEYKEAFKEIYPSLIEGRYSKGDGSLMKWITESNPTFDVSLYKDLMNSIEIERTGFTNAQSRMLDIIREHQTLLNKIPAKWFISNDVPIEYTVVSSTRSKETMKSGIDDEVDIFKK